MKLQHSMNWYFFQQLHINYKYYSEPNHTCPFSTLLPPFNSLSPPISIQTISNNEFQNIFYDISMAILTHDSLSDCKH